MNPDEQTVTLRYASGDVDRLLAATYPRLQFEEAGEDFWRTAYAPRLWS